VVSRNIIKAAYRAIKLDDARLISSIGFIFNIRYSFKGKPIPRGPENAANALSRSSDPFYSVNRMTEVSASFCTENATLNSIWDGNQAGKSVWTTCALLTRVILTKSCQSAKARLRTKNKFLAATIGNPCLVGWA